MDGLHNNLQVGVRHEQENLLLILRKKSVAEYKREKLKLILCDFFVFGKKA